MFVRIVTHCTWTSLGSILQAFGLQQALRKENIQSQILVHKPTTVFRDTKINSLKTLVQFFLTRNIQSKRRTAFQKRTQFQEKHMDRYLFESDEELNRQSRTEAVPFYLAGSDQIWNPDLDEPRFFLDFVKGTAKVSYAASMGKSEIPPEKEAQFRKYLEGFDHISVRERSCADTIEKLTNKPVHVHIDPTFLIPAEEWRQYEIPYDVKGPYILLYMLYWDSGCREKIQELKKQTGLPVYAVSGGLSRVHADRHLYDVGVEEFLWLVDHAAYVVTSSFHGAAFSAIFNKQFSPVVNPNLPSRIDHLMQCLQIPKLEISHLGCAEPLPYEQINERIAQERERSMTYLKRVLRK